MAVNTDIMVRFLADSKGVRDEVAKVEGTGSKLTSWAKTTAGAIGAAFAATAVVGFAKDAVDAASNLNESVSKTGVVFGAASGQIQTWAKDSATAMGLSEQAALEAAGTYGNLAVSLGLPQQQAADMSQSLVGLAGDLASFNNVPVDDALKALQSGLTGETEPLKRFGVNLNEAALKAQAMAMGLSDGKGPLTAAAKAQASYALIMQQSTTAQGDFARTSGGLANQQRIAAAQTENMKAQLGQALLPVIQQVVSIMNQYLIPVLSALAGFLERNSTWLVPLVGFILAVVAAVKLWTIVQAAFNVVMAANPIVLVVVAIAALVAGIIWAYQNVEVFRDIVDAAFSAVATAFGWITDAAKVVFDWLKANWPLLLAILLGPFGAAVLVIQQNWNTIRDAIMGVYNWVRDNWPLLLAILTGPIGIAVLTIQRNWDSIKEGAQSVLDFIRGIFDSIAGVIDAAVGAISSAIGRVVNAIKAPINAVLGAWNGIAFTMPRVEIPDWVPTIGGKGFGGFTVDFPNVPLLAKGGIVTGPTLAMLGERGAEAVVPLPRHGLAQSRVYNLNVSVAPGTDPAVTGRSIVQLIQAYERGNGRGWRDVS